MILGHTQILAGVLYEEASGVLFHEYIPLLLFGVVDGKYSAQASKDQFGASQLAALYMTYLCTN